MVIEKAVEQYNRFRGAEARASLIKVEGDSVWVLFEGDFCYTCGIRDWVEDFKYTLESLGVEAELVEIIEPSGGEEPWRIGVFRVKTP